MQPNIPIRRSIDSKLNIQHHFAIYSTSTISSDSVNLPLQGHRRSNSSTFLEGNMELYADLPLIPTFYLVPFARYSASKTSFCDFDLSGSPKVKYFTVFVKPLLDLIMMFCWYELFILYGFGDIPQKRFCLVTLTFQGRQSSNISPFFWKPVSRRFIDGSLLIRTLISRTVCEIFRIYRFSFVTLTLQGHQSSIYFNFFWKANMVLYLNFLLIHTSLSRTYWRDIPHLKILDCDLDLSGSPKGQIFRPFLESLIWDFILTFYWYELSFSYRWRDIPHLRFRLQRPWPFRVIKGQIFQLFLGSRYKTF